MAYESYREGLVGFSEQPNSVLQVKRYWYLAEMKA